MKHIFLSIALLLADGDNVLTQNFATLYIPQFF